MVDLYRFLDVLSECCATDDVLVTCAGSTFNAGPQGIKLKQGMRFIVQGGLAPMGYTLPAGIGISVALNKQRVICLSGEGSLQLNIQELQSVVHYQLPIKLFVINNEGYLTIRSTQERYFNRCIGESPTTGVSFPDTEKIAKAYGIPFVRLDSEQCLAATIDTVLNSDSAYICEVMIPTDQKVIRPQEELKEA